MITDVEYIILNKEYFELSPADLESVSELVQNAEEFDEMKWFLASTQNTLLSEKVEASPELKERVMSHLNQDKGQRKFWLNGVGVFLWPTEKEVVRRPAFQMSLAALLLIGFLMVYNRDITEGEVVMNDIPVETVDETSTLEEGKNTNDEETKVQEQDKLTTSDTGADGEGVAEDIGGGSGPSTEDVSNLMISEEISDISVDVEKPEMVTDLDGFYQPADEEMAEIDEEESNQFKSVNSANNNESDDQLLDMNQTVERDVDRKLAKENQDELKKNRTKNDANNSDKSKDYFDVVNQEETVALSEITVADSTVNTITTGSTSVNDPGSTYKGNEGIYNTATVDGDFGINSRNDFVAGQMPVNDTKELKTLFRSFK